MPFSKDAIKDAQAFVDGLETPYLKQLHQLIGKTLIQRESKERQQAILQCLKIAADLGTTVEELMTMPTKPKEERKTPKPPIAIYQHPDKPSIRWPGRGPAPKWMKEWLAADPTRKMYDLQVA